MNIYIIIVDTDTLARLSPGPQTNAVDICVYFYHFFILLLQLPGKGNLICEG